MKRLLLHLGRALGYGLLGILIAAGVALTLYLRSQPNLKAWHTARLVSEFRAADLAAVPDFATYLVREEQVFRELKTEVYDQVTESDRRQVNRYTAGSLADPSGVATNWNRTFEWAPAQPKGGVLLLHGLSDSPYSLRALGQSLYAQGYYVLGLRLPGHGTAPVGLTRATMEDFSAATRLAARHLRQRVPSTQPLFIVGYSNGGALAVDYALARLDGEDLPAVDGIVLISPAIGVSAAAALATWQRRLALVPGMEKAAWTSIDPEYDPYKYNSFAVNAGEQIHRLTQRIYERLDRLDHGSGVTNFPPVLAFQSVVDSTILPRAVIDRFLRRLAPGGHELVLYDIYRNTEARAVMVAQPEKFTEALVADATTPFTVTAITTENASSRRARTLQRKAGTTNLVTQLLPESWPRGIFSLSHVALPIPPSDPVYGDGSGSQPGRIQLGDLNIRGENGVLVMSPSVLLRLRYNPFYRYYEERVLSFLAAPAPK